MSTKFLSIPAVAAICHEANRGLCETQGDYSQAVFANAEQWQKDSIVAGVAWRIENPEATNEEGHRAWAGRKFAEGWSQGEVKDGEAKTHPNLVEYERLPPAQQAKDVLFRSIVEGLRPFTDTEGFDYTAWLRPPVLTAPEETAPDFQSGPATESGPEDPGAAAAPDQADGAAG